jgi:AbrB family looped-hinge helix DNA binding protein
MARAIIYGMNLKIDKAGRIVLPKPVRERFRLRAGTSLELEEHPDGLVLRPVGRCPSLVQQQGVWVHLGKAPQDFDWNRILDDARDERIKDVAGL